MKTTDELFRFHNQNFDEIRCKLDSTQNPRSFEKYPTSRTFGLYFPVVRPVLRLLEQLADSRAGHRRK